jgi:hypothetical protein
MKALLLAGLAAALALPALADNTPVPASSGKAQPLGHPSSGKPRAPVEARAEFAGDAAQVTLTFRGAASNVSVKTYGVGGLEVVSVEPAITGETVAAGDTRTVSVKFTKPDGRATLGVQVSGDFGGPAKSRAFGFAVGEPSAAQKAARSGAAQRSRNTGGVKAFPAKERPPAAQQP